MQELTSNDQDTLCADPPKANLSFIELNQRIIHLEKELQRIEYLFQSTSEAIMVMDEHLCVKRMNQACIKFFNTLFNVHIEAGMSLSLILANFSKAKKKIMHATQRAIQNKNKVSMIMENQSYKDKDYYCFEAVVNALHPKSEDHCEFIVYLRNLTEEKIKESIKNQQQGALNHACRRSAMKEVASAISHEMSQPLAAIVTYSRTCLLKKQTFTHAQLLQNIEHIAIQSEHAGEILHGMKNLMNKEGFHIEEVNIRRLIKESLAILNYELIDFDLKIELQITEKLAAEANKTHIMQVVLNLCRNSIEALKSSSEQTPKLIIAAHKENDEVVVHIKDNGPGILPEHEEKLFGSYFTTKPQGVGIGLSICRSIVQSYGGHLILQKHNEQGAWFSFTLPLSTGK